MKRGELWMASLDPIRGFEQAGTRPVLVLQADALNAFLHTAVAVPFGLIPCVRVQCLYEQPFYA